MRALLLLCVFAHASVWGNPEQPQDTIPSGERIMKRATGCIMLWPISGLPTLVVEKCLRQDCLSLHRRVYRSHVVLGVVLYAS